MDLNNRRTGKDATKPRALGLLGHSVLRKWYIKGNRIEKGLGEGETTKSKLKTTDDK